MKAIFDGTLMNEALFSYTPDSLHRPFPVWLRLCSATILAVSAAFLCVSVLSYNHRTIFATSLVPSLLVALSFAGFLTIYSLWQLRSQHRETDEAFRNADCEFSSIFQRVLDGILIIDNNGDCLDANPAAAVILRVPIDKLIGRNISHFLTPGDAFDKRWNLFLQNENRRGRAQLVTGDGESIFADFTAAENYLPGRHVVIFCDVTVRTHVERSLRKAEIKIGKQLDAVEAARAEAEAMRKATLTLSQNLAMDSVLDTLLQLIGELVPFHRASVLFVEDAAHVMVARETSRSERNRAGLALSALENVFLQKILFEHKVIALPDTANEADWRDAPPFDHTRSWMGIPLIAAGTVIGILSLSARLPTAFTAEHLRLAKNLAVSAAVAIQNARIHEQAAIYATELQTRLKSHGFGQEFGN